MRKLLFILCSILLVNIYVYAQPGDMDQNSANNELLEVVSMGSTSGVRELLKVGYCDVNYVTEDGTTALSIAAGRNDLGMMKLLVSHGADVSLGLGLDHLMIYANNYKNQEMVIWLNDII